jgi:adenosylmethionine-8-amino-7-oxononanoate aminotransferase/SAM-dependent methyltransferase
MSSTKEGTVPDLFWGPFTELCANQQTRVEERPLWHGMMISFCDALSLRLESDVPDILELAARSKGPVLELKCETGRILFPLAERGHEVVALDKSEHMLELLRRQLALLPAEVQRRVTLVQSDATEFDLEQRFPLIILPFFKFVLSVEPDQRPAMLLNAARHLTSKGFIAFDYPIYRQPTHGMGSVTTVELPLGEKTVAAILGWKLTDDCKEIYLNWFYKIPRDDGTLSHYLGGSRVALLGHKEVEQLLDETGFVIVERHRFLEEDIERHMLLCKRRGVTYPLWHPYSPMNGIEDQLTTLVEGKGCKVTDSNGKEYIDGAGGLWNTQCGQGDSEIIQAVTDQLHRMSSGTLFGRRTNEPALELARELIAMTPNNLEWVYLTGSGSESVELSIKIARLYSALQQKEQTNEIIYLDQSYHGTFFGSMSVSGTMTQLKQVAPFLVPGTSSIQAPNPERCPANVSYLDFSLSCAQMLEERAAKGGVAAFIVEPILASADMTIPLVQYFQRIEEICRKYDIILILDEVATGFGRTGRWFAAEHYDLRPDVLLLSKGLSSGYLPLGAVLFSARIGHVLMQKGSGLFHGSTTNGHPACCAAALASLRVMRRKQLVEHAAESGRYFRARLEETLLALPTVKTIRSIGLMLALILAQDDGTPATGAQAYYIWVAMKEAGVLATLGRGSLIFCPALVITRDEIEVIVRELHKILSSVVLRDGNVHPSSAKTNVSALTSIQAVDPALTDPD